MGFAPLPGSPPMAAQGPGPAGPPSTRGLLSNSGNPEVPFLTSMPPQLCLCRLGPRTQVCSGEENRPLAAQVERLRPARYVLYLLSSNVPALPWWDLWG